MQIDWFTFFAQIVNFLILVLLLHRFLYGPIMRAMDARQQIIADQFREAEALQEQAQEEITVYESRRQELAEVEDALLANAEVQAEARRRAMIQEGRDEVEEMMSRWYDEVEHQRDALLHDVRQQLGRSLIKLSSRVLADIANGTLDDEAVTRFADQLTHLPADERHALVTSGNGFEQDVIICSASDLSYPQRQRIIEALGLMIDDDARANGNQPPVDYPNEIGVRFEVTPDLICGVELWVRDRRVGWSMRDYLDELNEEIEASLTFTAEPV